MSKYSNPIILTFVYRDGDIVDIRGKADDEEEPPYYLSDTTLKLLRDTITECLVNRPILELVSKLNKEEVTVSEFITGIYQ